MVRPRGSHPRPVAISGAGSVPRTRPLQDDKAAHGAMVSSIVVVASSCNDDFAEPSITPVQKMDNQLLSRLSDHLEASAITPRSTRNLAAVIYIAELVLRRAA